MNEFEHQLKNNLRNNINEFNNKPEYTKIRELYRLHFDTIRDYIHNFGHKHAIEDISRLDHSLMQIILDNDILLKEINRAIGKRGLTLEDIK
jgi:hypothetical protein